MELLPLKIIVLTISGAVRLFFGLLPLVLLKTFHLKPEKGGITKKIISLLMFFGGGVLLATCFLHMMPHVRDSFTQAELDTPIPLPEVIFIAGFFLVYMLEDIVHGFVHKRKKHKAHKKFKQDPSASAAVTIAAGTDNKKKAAGVHNYGYNGNSETSLATPTTYHIARVGPNQVHNNNNVKTPIFTVVGSIPDVKILSPGVKAAAVGDDGSGDNGIVGTNFTYVDPEWFTNNVNTNSQVNLLGHPSMTTFTVRSSSLYDIPLGTPISGAGSGGVVGAAKGKMEQPGTRKIEPIEYDSGSSFESSSESAGGTSGEPVVHNRHDHHHHHEHTHSHLPPVDETEDSIAAAIRNLLIVVAISFHGIFEGMAIGLQTTEKDVWYLFLAVSLHECTILFCIGVELISSKTKVLRMLTYVVIVSLVCPIGMAVGIVVSEAQSNGGSDAAAGVKDLGQLVLVGSLQGLAAGTLLYVAFFEIFAAEGRNIKKKYLHIIVAIVGFLFMGALELVGGHSHGAGAAGHGHSHGPQVATSSSNPSDDHSDHSHDFHSQDAAGSHGHSHGGHGHSH